MVLKQPSGSSICPGLFDQLLDIMTCAFLLTSGLAGDPGCSLCVASVSCATPIPSPGAVALTLLVPRQGYRVYAELVRVRLICFRRYDDLLDWSGGVVTLWSGVETDCEDGENGMSWHLIWRDLRWVTDN